MNIKVKILPESLSSFSSPIRIDFSKTYTATDEDHGYYFIKELGRWFNLNFIKFIK